MISLPRDRQLRPHYLSALVAALVIGAAPATGAEANRDSPRSATATSPAASVSLELQFREECWAEIHDATGKRLFHDLGRPGQRLSYRGAAPFRLLLGNPRAVDIVLAGEAIDTRGYLPGQVKRLVLQPSAPAVAASAKGASEAPVLKTENAASHPATVVRPAPTDANRATSPSTAASSPAAPVSLELQFREECWAEIHDATGKRLFHDLGRPGQRLSYRGAAPFRVLLGNPRGVDIVLAGEAIDTQAYPAGRVKRLVLQPSAPAVAASGGAGVPAAGVDAPAVIGNGHAKGPLTPPAVDGPPLVPPPPSTESAVAPSALAAEEEPGVAEEPKEIALFDRAREPSRRFVPPPAAPEPPPAAEAVPEDQYPLLRGVSDLYVEYDSTIKAEDAADEFDDWLSSIDSDVVYELSPRSFLESTVSVVLNGEDDGFHRSETDYPDAGLYVTELWLQHDADRYSLLGGKYDPAGAIFGYAPAFFGNYSDDFSLEERIGLGGAWFFSKQAESELKLSVHAFFLDTSALSGELIGGGGRNVDGDEVGETGQLNNYLVALNGGSTGWNPGLRYTLGVAEQQADSPDLLDERAVLGAILYGTRLQSGADLEFSLDLLSLHNAGGLDEDTDGATLGIGYSASSYFIGASQSVRSIDPGDSTDRITEVVLGKEITDSVYLKLGYQRVDEGGALQESVGVGIRYSRDWRAH